MVKVKTLVLAIGMLVMAAAPAEAHRLSPETAKQKILQQINRECKGCTGVAVNRCRSRSPHRVTCRVAATLPKGNDCTWTGLVTASHRTSRIRVSAGNLVCSRA